MSDSKLSVTLEGVRHINTQTFDADSSVVLYESVDNPGFTDGGEHGMLIERVRIYPQNADPIRLNAAASFQFVAQIQAGTQTTIKEIDENQVIMQGAFEWTFSTGVGTQITKIWPLEMEPVAGVPIIVAPTFTVLHDAEVNHVSFQSKVIKTVIDYSIVKVPDKLFRTLYQNQTRVS